MAAITIEGVSKRFGASMTALEHLNLTVADGEFVALLGPSGCGKTTLLRIIAGLETRSSGRVLIGDRDVSDLPPAQRGLAMVFQNYAVFPHLSVFENVAFGLRMQKRDEATIRRQVQRAAHLLQIEPYLDRYPAKLSGGQRQRIAVARALAVEPAVLLMDEPLSNLDALLRLEMRAELKNVLKEAGTTTLYVTHDQTEAMGLADRIAVMHKGVIEQIDEPTRIYSNPASVFVGGFVGSPPMNFIHLTASGGALTCDGFSMPLAHEGPVLLGFRGEDVSLVEASKGMAFEVKVIEPMGSHLLLTGMVNNERVRVVAAPQTEIARGRKVGLQFDAARVVIMDKQTGKTF
jgi:multiple sugar transport system ATP-binding protein